MGADGVVRYANRSGSRRTGLGAGRRVADPELARAVITAAMGQVERQMTLAAGGAAQPGVECRVIPGLEGDDAFVFVGNGDEPDAGLGMDTLMQAIRGDLRDPLRAARAALELARQTDPDHGDELVFDALLDRVDGLLQVADKLVDLATLWDGQSLLADDRVELWSLLQQVWCEVEPLALGRQVRVRFTTDVDGRAGRAGSARWIRRVFVECLQGAVRMAPRGSEIEVEHLPGRPARQHRAAQLPAVCRRRPRRRRRGAQAVPPRAGAARRPAARRTGRPQPPPGDRAAHRRAAPQRRIAAGHRQAQHYARDLAQLVNRARRTGRAAPADAV